MLLALVMLASVCFPAMRVNAEETPDVTVTAGNIESYSVEGLAADVTVTVPDNCGLAVTYENGVFTVNAADAKAGTYTVAYAYQDADGADQSGSFTVTVAKAENDENPQEPQQSEKSERSEKAKEFDAQIADIQKSRVSVFDGKQETKDALVAQVEALKSSIAANTEITDAEKTELLAAVGTLTETVNGLTVAPASEPVISEAAEAYLKQIEELRALIENLNPDAPEYEDQLEADVEALAAVVANAENDWTDGILTEDEYVAIYSAADAVLIGQVDDPEPQSDFATTAKIVSKKDKKKNLEINFVDGNGNPLYSSGYGNYEVGKTAVSFETIAAQYPVDGYEFSHAYYNSGDVKLSDIKYNSGWYANNGRTSIPNQTTIFLVYKPNGSGGGSFVSKGNVGHLEVMVDAVATLKIEGEADVTTTIQLTTSDAFNISAEWNGQKFSSFSATGNLEFDSDQSNHTTLRQYGTFPVGTKDNPVWYTISIAKNVTFTLSDGSTHTVPVTFSIKGNFWSDFNDCPGTFDRNGDRQNWWTKGQLQGDNAGMDFPISGSAVGTAITKGKLAIKKTVTGTTDTDTFQFTIKNANGEYLIFNGVAYTGTSATVTDACKVSVTAGKTVVLTEVPVGVYTVTELQKDGYIVTDADGNPSGNYSLDYTVEHKEDSSIPVASFTNKKLTDQAGVSIQKTASGLPAGSTYPNPKVTIYKYDNGTKGESVVWSDTLTANGDRLYLTTTLTPGTYLIEETNNDYTGYNCTASLSGNNGMTFTVTAGNRYDLTVNNLYSAIPPESEDTVYIQVQKTFEGLTADQIDALKNSFTITVTEKDGTTHDLKLTDAGVVQNGSTFTWTLAGLNAGTYTVSESGQEVGGYDVTTTGTGAITTAASTIRFIYNDDNRENSCSGHEIPVGEVDYIIVKLTEGYFVWTKNTLSANKRSECIKFINSNKNEGGPGFGRDATAQNCHFFSGDKLTDEDGLYFREGNVRYDKKSGILHFDASKQWAQCIWGNYTVTGNDAEVSVKNTYTPSTTTVTISKTVSGNMGNTDESFSFAASLTDKSSQALSMKGITYTLYQKDATGNYVPVENGSGTIELDVYTFSLKHDQKIVFGGVKIGANMTVTETTDYTVTYKIDGSTDQNSNVAVFEVGNNGNTVAFNNHKSATIDTGIVTDSIPYILLLTMAVIGAGALLLKKRRAF